MGGKNSVGSGGMETAEHPSVMKWYILWEFTKKKGFFLFIIDVISTLITLYEGMSIMYY